jgi:predicted dehydrogenase
VKVTDSRKLKVGIIGCGVGFLHLQGFAEIPRADVVAIAGLDEERCRELAKQFDVPRVYRDYQELIADPDVEAVTVAVPNILHVPVALAALEAGKHVMVEKPLAPTAAEGQKIIEAACRANRVLGVVFNADARTFSLSRRRSSAGTLARYITPAHSGCDAQGFPD